MSDKNLTPPLSSEGDVVLREVWRAKDALSAAYGHDLDRLFEETRAREKHSGHEIVSLSRPSGKTGKP